MTKQVFLKLFTVSTFFMAMESIQAMTSVNQLPCGTNKRLSIAERIRDCNEAPRSLSTGQTFTLVARVVEQQNVYEYFRDDASQLIWGPEASDAMTFRDAKKYCARLSDLELEWHLPEREEFLKAGNKDNNNEHYNTALLEVLDLKNKWFWSSTSLSLNNAWYYNSAAGAVYFAYRGGTQNVRCVGH